MNILVKRVRDFVERSWSAWLRFRISNIPGVRLPRSAQIRGRPIVEICRGAEIHIGENVIINSSNRSYHVNMHSPVKLYADRKGAIIKIGERTQINGTCVHAYASVSIGKNCMIAANCQIMDCSGHELSFDHVENRINTTSRGCPVIIEDNVWIGANCIVLPGVRIGHGSVIGAGSVVTKDVPPMVVAAGNPAHTVKTAGSATR